MKNIKSDSRHDISDNADRLCNQDNSDNSDNTKIICSCDNPCDDHSADPCADYDTDYKLDYDSKYDQKPRHNQESDAHYDAYYDTIAPSYDRLYYDEQKAKLDVIRDEIGRLKMHIGTADLLDVGCGTGISTEFFEQYGCICTGIDPSKALLDLARPGRQINYIRGYAHKLPFKDRSFGMVISLTAMQNFPDIGKAIDEMQRVLDYNPGYMIISYLKKAPNAKEIESKIKGSFKKRIVSVIEERKDMIFFLKI